MTALGQKTANFLNIVCNTNMVCTTTIWSKLGRFQGKESQ